MTSHSKSKKEHPERNSSPRPSSDRETTPSKARRPLPVPKEPQPVPASTFYGTSTASTSKQHDYGSSSTSYIAPEPSTQTQFREPELVNDDQQSPPPEWNATVDWEVQNTDNSWGDPHLNWTHALKKIDIDGRDMEEEENWCDPGMREKRQRPGPGLLPTVVEANFPVPLNTLWSVTASLPPPKSESSRASISSARSSASPPPRLSTASSYAPPTADEVRTAIPHPNAYYCNQKNGWVLVYWCSSAILPPLAHPWTPDQLPDQQRRKNIDTCHNTKDWSWNKTHHFHRYERAVDSKYLTTPYKRSEWEVDETKKRRRRKMTIIDNPDSVPSVEEEDSHPESETVLLDLFICCQCSVYCLVSRVIPGVIPLKLMEEFTKEKMDNPRVDVTRRASALQAWETVHTYVHTPPCRVLMYPYAHYSQYIYTHSISNFNTVFIPKFVVLSKIDFSEAKSDCYLYRDRRLRTKWAGPRWCA